jgi:molecular chaperone DnaJ
MAKKRDCYDVLGVGRNASDEEIKRSYRKLARQDQQGADRAAVA